MAIPKKAPKKVTPKTIVPKSNPTKKTKIKKGSAKALTTTSSCGCCDCTDQPSGIVWTCEDGTCVPILPPTYFGVFVFDPTGPPLPYWERPANFPVAVLQDMFTAFIANATSTQKSDLYTLVAPWVASTAQAACVTKCGP